MALFQRNEIGLRDKSISVNVPNNDVARLMYYIDCVCSAIEYNDSDIRRFRDYKNWSWLSNEDVRVLLALCLTLSPDVFDNKVFFHSDALCGDSGNKFFEISQVRRQLLVVESIAVAGQTRHVNQIMTYKMSWMYNNYLNPIKGVAERFNNQRRLTAPRPNQSSSCTIS